MTAALPQGVRSEACDGAVHRECARVVRAGRCNRRTIRPGVLAALPEIVRSPAMNRPVRLQAAVLVVTRCDLGEGPGLVHERDLIASLSPAVRVTRRCECAEA